MKNLLSIVKIALLVILVPLSGYAQKLEVGKDKVDLEHFPLNFDVFSFYEKSIKGYQAFVNDLKQGEEKKAFARDEYVSVEKIDTINVSGEKDLYLFDMKGSSAKDTLAAFSDIVFEQLSMVTNHKKQFVALDAVSHSFKDGGKNFQNLKTALEAKYGKGKTEKPVTGFTGEYYYWTTKDFIIRLGLNVESDTYYASTLFMINAGEFAAVKKSLSRVRKYWHFE